MSEGITNKNPYLRFYFWCAIIFIAFVLGIYFGGLITYGAMSALRDENKKLTTENAELEKDKKAREVLAWVCYKENKEIKLGLQKTKKYREVVR